MRECWICGKHGVKTLSSVRKDIVDDDNNIISYGDFESIGRWYCEECYAEVSAKLETSKAAYIALKKSLMLERAVRILEKQNVDIYEYKSAIEWMTNYVGSDDDFDSAHEMIAAIVLIHDKEKAIPQKKIGRYRVDFCLPKRKIILEIDGGLHAYSAYKDNKRDIELRGMLGDSWEVVRISTNYLDQNAKQLMAAVLAVKDEKQKIRRENFGVIPEWYSKREKAKRPKRKAVGDDALLI